MTTSDRHATTDHRIDDLHDLLQEALMDDDFAEAALVRSVLGDLERGSGGLRSDAEVRRHSQPRCWAARAASTRVEVAVFPIAEER
ncbi:hypothetical protein [Nocardioides sambongensis]|uniref:hypothetical protein n=1 Tax=Nocardioides sambongensis TaxID=2589074 RepID=UPI00112B3E43|nr:hypothetical protein [Nocardioides sambongensis]